MISDFQLVLVGVIAVIIVGVLVYNRWQESNYKRRAEQMFSAQRDESQRNRYWSAGWIPIIARTDDIYNGGPEFLAAFRSARSMRRQHPAA